VNQRLANFVERSPRSVRPMRAPRSRLGSREIQSQFSKREQPGSDARYKKFAKSHEHPSSIANHSRGLCSRRGSAWGSFSRSASYAQTVVGEDSIRVNLSRLRTSDARGANWVFSELPQPMSRFHRAKGQRTVGTVRFLRGWKCQARLPSG